jgi:hypothetical protein
MPQPLDLAVVVASILLSCVHTINSTVSPAAHDPN